MSSIRQQIVDAVAARLALIANGKTWTLPSGTHTCGTAVANVFEWRKVPVAPAQCPAIAIYDTDSTLGESTLKGYIHQLKFSLVGFLTGSTAADAARTMQADILAAIGSDATWGGLAIQSYPEMIPMQQEQAGEVVAACQIDLLVVYQTGRWQI